MNKCDTEMKGHGCSCDTKLAVTGSHNPVEEDVQPYYSPMEPSIRALLAAASGMSEGVALVDQDCRILHANQAFLEICGTKSPCKGSPLHFVLRPTDEDHALDPLLVCSGRTSKSEMLLRAHDGTDRSVIVSTGPLKLTSGNEAHYVFVSDISSIRRLENERLQLMEQSLRNRQMDQLGTFAGGLSHEFNNILQVIRANAEYCHLALQYGHDPSEKLNEIQESVDRAGRMLRQLLGFSRNQLLHRTETSLAELTRRVISLTRLRSTQSVEISLDRQCVNDRILAEEAQIEQVLYQLLSNSIQALPETGGWINVRISNATRETSLRMLGPASHDGGYIQLEMEDNGGGINERDLDRVFDPFFTTRGVGEGSGLGLAMAHGIIRSHEGAIEAQTTGAGGTLMRILLKLAPSKS